MANETFYANLYNPDYNGFFFSTLEEYEAGRDKLNGLGCEEFEDHSVFEGTAEEYAEQYIDDAGLLDSMPENLRPYFDMAAFARDMQYGGDIYEFEFAGKTWTASR